MKKVIWDSYQRELCDCNPSWKDMISGGFVVPEDIDELALYKKRALMEECNMANSHIIVNPTIDCNFNCWYCYENHKPSKMANAVMDHICKLIDKLCAKSRNIELSFFGGEPLLCYKNVVLPIIRYAFDAALRSKVHFTCNCTTNGSLLTKDKIQELQKYNFNFAQITLDGNETAHNQTRYFADGKGSFKTIIANIKELAKSGIRVTLRVNYTQSNIGGIQEIPDRFSDLGENYRKNICVSFHKVWQEGEIPTSDLDDAVKSFVKSGFVASIQTFGQYCYGDLRNSVVINFNGDVFKCTAVNFDEAQRDGYLNSDGNIVWKNDSLEKRMLSKFTNRPCLNCSIFPICHGGCTSRTLENTGEYCILGFDDGKKKEMLLNRLLYNIRFVWANGKKNILI